MGKVGIALGGGGVAGTAHIGVLSALEEAGIRIDCIAGSSSGAIIAALYSYGYSAGELMTMIPTINRKCLDYDYFNFIPAMIKRRPKLKGLIKGERILNFIADKTGEAYMSDLKLPVSITATDLSYGKQILFASRPLQRDYTDVDVVHDIRVADAVRASLSIPVLFKPYFFKERVLIDGGLMDNCPVDAVRALGADQVIAVDLISTIPSKVPVDSLRSIVARSVTINLALKSKQHTKSADIVLRPEVGPIGVFDFAKLGHCIDAGYEYTRGQIKHIKEALKWNA
ncbi:patatin-like phospholipase family protein [Paenibacillus xerothermodurans]|uniref:PNPLA domain-containing protein n=1 Tax=Paenibacillus xerothermodurans TaxID=1977292 RepID=A0A2W1NY83_PAEXE|nr:patatin-like phospholipase family protein [Paenibacillus xerothermodurans]PZE19828.1 hypothetical protein CBW46_015970 [Paenibacillus xerothermodurans]